MRKKEGKRDKKENNYRLEGGESRGGESEEMERKGEQERTEEKRKSVNGGNKEPRGVTHSPENSTRDRSEVTYPDAAHRAATLTPIPPPCPPTDPPYPSSLRPPIPPPPHPAHLRPYARPLR